MRGYMVMRYAKKLKLKDLALKKKKTKKKEVKINP